jgi:hypothetical protein
MIKEIPILSVLPAKRFHSCVLMTYSFDFNFFNHSVLRSMSRIGIRNTCVFVDDSMFQMYLGNLSGYALEASKRYSLCSITSQGVFHPKLYLFFGRDGHGFLIIGSGNLTSAGHGYNQELWSAFHIDGPGDLKAPLFNQAWEYAKSIGNTIPGISTRKLEWITTHTPWLQDITQLEQSTSINIGDETEAFFLTNKGGSIFNKIQNIVQEDVTKCTIISPFFDIKTAVLLDLESQFPDAVIDVIIQPNNCSADFSNKNYKNINFIDWNSIIPERQDRYLHAKLLHIQTRSAEYCLFGSANVTAPAFGTTKLSPSNEEVCLLLKKDNANWLKNLGLNKPGNIISAQDLLSCSKNDDKEISSYEDHPFRIKAIDRINNHLHIYLEKDDALHDTILVLFNGWGEKENIVELNEYEFIEKMGYYHVTIEQLSEKIFYGQIFNSKETPLSNKQIIHDMIALSRTNPDPNTQRLEEVLDRIESSDAEMVEILSYLDPEDLILKNIKGSGTSKENKEKESIKNDGSGEVLSYEEFTQVSLKYQHKGGISYLYGTHRIERILESLRTIFEKMKIKDIDISGQDEEADKDDIDTGTGRADETPPDKKILIQTPSAFSTLQKSILRFFNRYISILEKQRDKKHRLNVLDTSMFAIALHLLLDFLDKPIRIKQKDGSEYDEILLKADGKYFDKVDYCRITTEIIGKFTLLLINGIDDANDEYVKLRIEKCKRMAFWHAVCCIAQLTPFKCDDEKLIDSWLSWKWELINNLRYYYAPGDASDERIAREEIEHRIQMFQNPNDKSILIKFLNTWSDMEKDKRFFNNQKYNKDGLYKEGSRVFSERFGFSHLLKVTSHNDQHKITLARVGCQPSKEGILDFKYDKQYIAEIAKTIVLK